MLKISGSTESKTQPGGGGVGVGDSRAGREESKLDGSEVHDGKVDSGEVEDDEVGEKVQKGLSPRICISPLWTFLFLELN